MYRLLVLVVTLTACLGEEQPQASADPNPIRIPNDHIHGPGALWVKENLARLRGDLHRVIDHRRRGEHDDHRHHDRHSDRDRHHDNERWWEYRSDRFEHEEPEGPVILRSIRPDSYHKPDIARQNKIIADVYSPDYAEPTWVLDYRYLKTGGRDYTRGPGGQIIILPKGVHTDEHKEFKNYDELIEHLRLKNLAERKKPQYFMPLGHGANDYDRGDDHRGYDEHRSQDRYGYD